ncbi:MAG: hypothetical protein IT406_01675 [Candidatus Yanofskybacteria bacterium]|nr:hypothetical protein [Candidatus Yanofskybacteria bacterium]
MKKLMSTECAMVAFAILAIAVIVGVYAPVAEAQGRYRPTPFERTEFGRGIDATSYVLWDGPAERLANRLCANHRGTGDQTEASWCYGDVYDSAGWYEGRNTMSTRDQAVRRHGTPWGNPGYAIPRPVGYDGHGLNRGLSHRDRNVIVAVGAGLGAIWAVDKFVLQPKRDKKREEMAESRHQEVMEALRAREAELNSEEEVAETPAQEVPRAASPAKTPRDIILKNGHLCNKSGRKILVIVDGQVLVALNHNEAVRLADLPKGDLDWAFAR